MSDFLVDIMQLLSVDEKNAGQRLDKYLRKALPAAGSGFIYKMLRKKNITLNASKAEGGELLNAGDEIRFFFSDETFKKFRGNDITDAGQERGRRAFKELAGLPVIYEDEDLIFLDKSAGLLSVSDESASLSANDWVYGYCLDKGISVSGFRPTVCNRLDRNTSGLLLCAKSYAGARFLSDMIQGHELKKYYHAIVEGELSGEAVLRGIWKKDKTRNIVRIDAFDSGSQHNIVVVNQGGKHKNIMDTGEQNSVVETDGAYVETRYHVLDSNGDYSLVEVELITGRSHQIRAHFASIGHPLAGDIKYGGSLYRGRRVQQLRALRIEFPHIEGAFSRLSGKGFELPGLVL